ncbi:MAG: hypothetical protein K6F11_08160 [Lachnospiraceae bacterium]|nr:hypothetical protein [Lachnospiraceae bacterium]
MNRALRELVENAKPRSDFKMYEYNWFLLIPTKKAYKGIFGKNGYNSMIILGYDHKDGAYYRLDSGDTDDFCISGMRYLQFDVPRKYGCIRAHFQGTLMCGGMPLSSVTAERMEQRKV